jgi:hypothetical protein
MKYADPTTHSRGLIDLVIWDKEDVNRPTKRCQPPLHHASLIPLHSSSPVLPRSATAWDIVEELSAAASHAEASAKADPIQSDPLEKYCDANPDADECRVYGEHCPASSRVVGLTYR